MKKLILFFAAIAMTACGPYIEPSIDYGCSWRYQITNETDSDIIYADIYYKEAIIISPKETVQLTRHQSAFCNEGSIPADISENSPEELMLPSDCRLIVGNEFVHEAIWKRDFWDFTAEPYRATYTLILTHELLDSIKTLE